MHLTREDIQNTERIKRFNIINSITGIKPANLIGTISADGKTNLAIFSSDIHLGSNPALIGFIAEFTSLSVALGFVGVLLFIVAFTYKHRE